MENQKKRVLFVTQGAVIAALYVALTMLAAALGLASGVIQVRISEALTILPFFTPAAIPGLFLGCLISNFVTGCLPWDIVFGSLATLIGAIVTYLLRKGPAWLAPIPPILSNTIIIPFVLRYVYEAPDAMWFLFLTVFVGELISCGILGMIFLYAVRSRRLFADRNLKNNKAPETKKKYAFAKKPAKVKIPDALPNGYKNPGKKLKKTHKKHK